MKPWKNLIGMMISLSIMGCTPLKKLQTSLSETPVALSQDSRSQAQNQGSNLPMKGESGPAHIPIRSEEVNYDGRTNFELLLEAVEAMPMSCLSDGTVDRNDRIVVSSLATAADSETDLFPTVHVSPLVTFMEDALTLRITKADFRTVERDIDILTRMYHENGGGEKYLISISPDYSPTELLQVILELVQDKRENLVRESIADKILTKFIFDFDDSNLPFIRYPFNGKKTLQYSSKIKAATHLLSFRILDCLVNYRPTEADTGAIKSIERVAIVKLHLRLTTREGVTIWSDIVTGEAREVTPIKALAFVEREGFKLSDLAPMVTNVTEIIRTSKGLIKELEDK